MSLSKIKSIVIAASLTLASQAVSQAGPYDQSSSNLEWKTMETEFVKLIYPDYMRPKADEIAKDIDYFSKRVGLTYGIQKPRQITLIIRPEFADPNGFVTLAPRRSEWHAMSTFSPITGGLDWYQILSIHEYRHVNQFDNFNKNTVRFMDYLFGDTGILLAAGLSLQSWYFEGDAVWAETYFTDAGRGRLPSFTSRLKALLIGKEEIPTYDQFLNGSFNRPLPNQYVYGFFLISSGYKRFGEDFWAKVVEDVSQLPLPFRFESAFRRISGIDFQTFYNETFRDLRKTWQAESKETWEIKPYADKLNAQVFTDDMYFINWDLDHYHSIQRRRDGIDTKIIDLPYSKDLARVEFSPTMAIQNEFQPDWRFGQKSSSNLVLIDLASGGKKRLTSDERYYNPHFTHDYSAVLAAGFVDSKMWEISQIDFKGKVQKTLQIPGWDLVEAVALEGDKLAVIANDKNGQKAILIASFNKGLISTLLAPSRNAIFGLKSDHKSRVFFEGQIDGNQEILLVDATNAEFRRCTNTPMNSTTPAFAGDGFTYSRETPNGFEIHQAKLSDCVKIPQESLLSYKYLGSSPNDSYIGKAPAPLPDLAAQPVGSVITQAEGSYNRFEKRAFTPHSWSFFAGRGYGLQLSTDNYLNDFGINLQVGREAEDNAPYTSLQVDFKMFVPVFSLLADLRKRSFEPGKSDIEITWRELAYGGQISLPFNSVEGLWQTTSEVGHSLMQLKDDDFEVEKIETKQENKDYIRNSSFARLALLKDNHYRSILPPLGLSLNLQYDSAKGQDGDKGDLSTRSLADVRFYLPGIFANHGLRLTASGEKQSENRSRYPFLAPTALPGEYVLARGYDYETVDQFSKFTGDYVFPLAYPDYNLGGWIHFKRFYGELYYDYSRLSYADHDWVLDSTGVELHVETKILRFLPLDLGFRYIRKLADDSDQGEVFLSSNISAF